MKKIAIIGGGITGLCAGIFALKKGYQVSIYEKNAFAGGCCTGWVRDGVYIDNCMHWLTGTNHSSKTFKLWKKVGAISENSNLYQSDYFYKSIYNNESIELSKDVDKLSIDMHNLSKEDSVEIKRFINTVKGLIEVFKEQNIFDYVFKNPLAYMKLYFRYRHLSLEDLSKRFKHPLLQKMFTDYLPKEYNSLALIYAYATFASGNGKVYMKGSKAFANNIFNYYVKLGGFIHFNSEVTKICIYNNRINNICINDSEIVVADEYVYTGDPFYLFDSLISSSLMPNDLEEKRKRFKSIPSSYHAAYEVLKKDCEIVDSIIFEIPEEVVGKKTITRLMVKDYSYLYQNGEKTVIQAFITQDMSDYVFWEELYKNNKDEYNKVKKKTAEKLKSLIIKEYPKLKDSIKLLDSWTPFTYNNYFHSYYGSYMGFTFTKDSLFKDISYKVKGINNFYLATYWQKLSGGLPVSLKMGYDLGKIL